MVFSCFFYHHLDSKRGPKSHLDTITWLHGQAAMLLLNTSISLESSHRSVGSVVGADGLRVPNIKVRFTSHWRKGPEKRWEMEKSVEIKTRLKPNNPWSWLIGGSCKGLHDYSFCWARHLAFLSTVPLGHRSPRKRNGMMALHDVKSIPPENNRETSPDDTTSHHHLNSTQGSICPTIQFVVSNFNPLAKQSAIAIISGTSWTPKKMGWKSKVLETSLQNLETTLISLTSISRGFWWWLPLLFERSFV